VNLGKIKGRGEMEGYEYGNAGAAESGEIDGGRKRECVLAAIRAGREGEE
jgi:hypothetical protein